jgi:hypothetical protein
MSKIWEVDFTNFSGVSDVAYDNIGTEHLTVYTGIVRSNPLPEFTYRPGIAMNNNASVQNYDLKLSNATNAFWSTSYSQRSFVMWAYLTDLTDTGLWDDSFDTGIWSDFATSGDNSPREGFIRDNISSNILLNLNGTNLGQTTPVYRPGWHLFVATVDKLAVQSRFYVDAVQVYSGSNLPSNTLGGQSLIGENKATGEGTYQLAYCATYNNILTQSDVTTIYDTFLKDNVTGSAPYQTLTGTLYDLDGAALSGASAYLIHENTQSLVYYTTTGSGGNFTMDIPYSGSYTLVTTSTPSAGSRAIPVIATSGGVYFP